MSVEVSVICDCYNHEKYIRDAIEGFICQKTNFAYEVLIHDDASTDRSADIIKEYEEKYPDLIKVIYQKENQYSKKEDMVFKIQKERVKGKYVAICEGDDYWTDENKLQAQYDLMEANANINICAHWSNMIDACTGELVQEIRPMQQDCVLPVEKVIEGGGGFVATNSLFIRSAEYVRPMKFRENCMYDYPLQIQGALAGGMLYIDKCMSVYRTNSENSWTQQVYKEKEKLIKHNEQIISMLKDADYETDGLFHDSFQKCINNYGYAIAKCKNDYVSVLKNKNFKQEELLEKIKYIVKAITKYKQ